MKKSINIAGIIFLLVIFLGIVFKRLHYPGASILMTFGIFLFIAVYLLSFLIHLIKLAKAEGAGINKIFLYLGFTGIIILTFGILSKIMHWPGAYYGLWGGIGLVSFVFLMFLVLNIKSKEKVSMISVLIVVVLLGTFSFNTFRIGNIRSMNDAYLFSEASFSANSRILWKECERIINDQVAKDTLASNIKSKNDLMSIHLKVQETDLIIGSILEKINIAKSEGLTINGPVNKSNFTQERIYIKEPLNKSNFMQERIYAILMTDEGLPKLDRSIAEYRKLIETAPGMNAEEKQKLSESLVYPYLYEGSGLLYKFTGGNDFTSDLTLCNLMLWKSKIWEIEYVLLSRNIKI